MPPDEPRTAVTIPTRLLILTSAILSTFVSVIAGVFLYLESLDVLKDTVAESSEATVKHVRLRLRDQLKGYQDEVKSMKLFFGRYEFSNSSQYATESRSQDTDNLLPKTKTIASYNTKKQQGNLRDACQLFNAATFARLKASGGYGSHLIIVKNPTRWKCLNATIYGDWENPDCSDDYTWSYPTDTSYCDSSIYYDPVVDSKGAPNKVWVKSEKFLGDGTGKYYEEWLSLNNETGMPTFNLTDWAGSSDFRWRIQGVLRRDYENGSWDDPYLWTGVNDVPYIYSMYGETISPKGFPFTVFFGQYFLIRPWSHLILEYKTDTTQIVIFNNETRQIFAHTLYTLSAGPPIAPRCYGMSWASTRTGADCILNTTDLGVTVDFACSNFKIDVMETRNLPGSAFTFLNIDTGRNQTISLDGEEYFTRVSYISSAGQQMRMYAAWLKPVSSVSERVYDAFVKLILTSVAILGIDLVLAVVEYLLIAKPITYLAEGMSHLMRLDMASVTVSIRQAKSVVMIKEVSNLIKGLEFAHTAITEYKTYIPETVLEEDAPSEMEHYDIEAPGVPMKDAESNQANVAIVFTDIVDSTGIWDEAPEAMRVALKMHNSVMRQCIGLFKGYEVKTIGDAFMVAFPDITSAVNFGLAVQTKLHISLWPDTLYTVPSASNGLNVRIGIHYGPVQVEANPVTSRYDYFGGNVNTAARLESIAQRGTIAMTGPTFSVLGKSDTTILDHGSKNIGDRILKGLSSPTSVTLITPLHLRARLDDNTQHNPLVRQSIDSQGTSTVSVKSSSTTASIADLSTTSSCSIAWIGVNHKANSLSLLNYTLSLVLNCVDRCEGRVQSVVSSSVVVGWNIQKRLASHMTPAFHCTTLIFAKRGPDDISIGLSTGACLFGSVGSSERRFVIGAGPCVHLAYFLALTACETRISVLYAALPTHRSAKDDPYLESRLMYLGDWEILSQPTAVYQISTTGRDDTIGGQVMGDGSVFPMRPACSCPVF